MCRSPQFDVVYLYREAVLIGPALRERLARWRNPHLVYDFANAIWLSCVSPRNRYLSHLKLPSKTKAICRMAAAVTVGNEALADFARHYNPAVTVVPSIVSLRDYRPRPHSPAGGLPVIWMDWKPQLGSVPPSRPGRAPHAGPTAAPPGRRHRNRRPPSRGSRRGVPPVRAETEVEDLSSIAVGIMPLFDDPWARGKCAMKAIQYLGLGVPAVVSPVGANREVVGNGVCGFHAANEGEWVQALERLLDDGDLRFRMGVEGRHTVEGHYSAEVQAPRVGALLRSLRP